MNSPSHQAPSNLIATKKILKPSKWFSKKSLTLDVPGRPIRSSDSTSTSTSAVSSPTQKSSNREDELRQVFHRFDEDGDGKISADELRSYFGSIGEQITVEEAEGAINELDSDGDNMLDFQDFMKLMNAKKEGEGDDDDLRKAFEMFVWEKGSGCITPKGLQRMLHRLGDEKSYDQCVAMIGAFDKDQNGVLDFNEFHQMMA